jgi:hypothetical protein
VLNMKSAAGIAFAERHIQGQDGGRHFQDPLDKETNYPGSCMTDV